MIGPYLRRVDYKRPQHAAGARPDEAESSQKKSPLELLEDFYLRQNSHAMSQEQRLFSQGLMDSIFEEDMA